MRVSHLRQFISPHIFISKIFLLPIQSNRASFTHVSPIFFKKSAGCTTIFFQFYPMKIWEKEKKSIAGLKFNRPWEIIRENFQRKFSNNQSNISHPWMRFDDRPNENAINRCERKIEIRLEDESVKKERKKKERGGGGKGKGRGIR